jgi:hypothetical protein
MSAQLPLLKAPHAVKLMKPVLRLLLRAGLRFQELLEVLKIALVELASEEINQVSSKVNSSRISVLSGLHRKDSTRILKNREVKEVTRGGVIAKILARWEADSRFTTKHGAPRTLSFGPPESEFSALVRAESSDFNPGTVLFELERMEVVQRTARGLKLIEGVFTNVEDASEGWEMLAHDSELLIQSVVQNLSEPQKLRNLHARTEYDNVFLDAVPEIRRWLADEGKAFHKRVREFLSDRDKDLASNQKERPSGVRVSFGSFSAIQLPQSSDEEPRTLKKGN